jgi:hypothetical protein
MVEYISFENTKFLLFFLKKVFKFLNKKKFEISFICKNIFYSVVNNKNNRKNCNL